MVVSVGRSQFSRKLEIEIAELGKSALLLEPKARSIGSCSKMKYRLDLLFPKGTGFFFFSLPMPRKQIICATISSVEITDLTSEELRGNVVACNTVFLLKLRFGSIHERIHSVLAKLTPKCLPIEQYDLLEKLLERTPSQWFEAPTLNTINTDDLSEYLAAFGESSQ